MVNEPPVVPGDDELIVRPVPAVNAIAFVFVLGYGTLSVNVQVTVLLAAVNGKV